VNTVSPFKRVTVKDISGNIIYSIVGYTNNFVINSDITQELGFDIIDVIITDDSHEVIVRKQH